MRLNSVKTHGGEHFRWAPVRPEVAQSREGEISPLRNHGIAAFTFVEMFIALGVFGIGLLGIYGMILQGGRMASAAEENALAFTALEQRVDQLRELTWPELTGGTGITSKVWTARPIAMTGIPVASEALTISPYD